MQRVERVEELGLGLLALGEELDVVHQEHVDVAVARGELIALSFAHGLDELGHEALARDVLDTQARGQPEHLVPDRDEQVGLAEPTPP